MNTSQIKNFAAQSRNILKAGVIQRIQILGFDVDGNLTKGEPTRIEIQGGATLFAGEIFDGSFYDRWMSLRHRIQEKGVKEVYEEAAYTWFNRLVAIRIMMKNGFIDPVLAYTNEQTRPPESTPLAASPSTRCSRNRQHRVPISRTQDSPRAIRSQRAHV